MVTPKSVLVTGASGYLGERVSIYLRDVGFHVRMAIGRRRPTWAEHQKSIECSALDVTSPVQCQDAVKDVDAIVHLAALNEWRCAEDPRLAIAVNSVGTFNLLEAAAKRGGMCFVFMSTAHVYGSLSGHVDESVPAEPVHPYAYTHHFGEDLVRSFSRSGKVTGLSFRLSNAIGAPVSPDVDRWTLVVNDLCKQVAMNRSMRLTSDGQQCRDFVTIKDVCRAVEHVLRLSDEHLKGDAYNLGGNTVLSIWEMAQLIADRVDANYGFRPVVERIQPVAGSASSGRLNFDSTRFGRTGFRWSGRLADEIDDMLVFCMQNFGKSPGAQA